MAPCEAAAQVAAGVAPGRRRTASSDGCQRGAGGDTAPTISHRPPKMDRSAVVIGHFSASFIAARLRAAPMTRSGLSDAGTEPGPVR